MRGRGAEPSRGRGQSPSEDNLSSQARKNRRQSLVRREATTPALHKKRVGKQSRFPALFFVDKSYSAPGKSVLLHSQETARTRSGQAYFRPPTSQSGAAFFPAPNVGAESQRMLPPQFGGFPVAPEPLRGCTFHYKVRGCANIILYSFFIIHYSFLPCTFACNKTPFSCYG